MTYHVSFLTMMPVLFMLVTAGPAAAEEPYATNASMAAAPTHALLPEAGPIPRSVDAGRMAEIGRPSFPVRQSHESHGFNFQTSYSATPNHAPAVASAATSWDRPVRLPSVDLNAPSHGPADGTWREEGRYVVINLDGRELRLVRQTPASTPAGTPTEGNLTGGTVYGRLLHKGGPLVNCQVTIIPMRKGFTGYAPKGARKLPPVTTDIHGVYRFDNVPPGTYKLSWLPQGTNQWIRRIAMRPDLTVRTQETTQVKDIPVALRTIN